MCSRRAIAAVALGLMVGSCGGDRGTGPLGPTSYQGQWTGRTTQGESIEVTVSADQRVTAIAIGFRFGGCAGWQAFSGLSLTIARVQPPPGNPQPPGPFTDNPGFGYGSGPPDGPNFTQIYGAFTSGDTATGTVVFGGHAGCGGASANWTATKRR